MIEVRANGNNLELKVGEKITYTKQVSDISDISTSNASATTSLKVPRTPNNTQALTFLGHAGDGSQIPYQRVFSQVLDDGIPLVKSGWLDVTSTDGVNYNINVKDGIIDFFKAIQGLKLGVDIDLSELNHIKNVETVVNSFDNEFYTYLVNDYGGRTILDLGLGTRGFNIDYLVPSASLRYMWQKVFDKIAFTYSGQIFNDENFINAWWTFPKTNSELVSNLIGKYTKEGLQSGFYGFAQTDLGLTLWTEYPEDWTLVEDYVDGWIIPQPQPHSLSRFLINQISSYQFKINFEGDVTYKFSLGAFQRTVTAPAKFIMYKNGQTESSWYVYGGEEATFAFNGNAGDVITFRIVPLSRQEVNEWLIENEEVPVFYPNFEVIGPLGDSINIELEAYQVEYAETDFNNTFKDFGVTDFVKEVMWRFGLVAIPDTENNHVTFYNIDELLDTSRGVYDWSDKYVRRLNERYIIGSYAQNNRFRHKYTQENASYNDGNIPVLNENLDFERAIISSKLYSPEESLVYLQKIGSPSYVAVFPTLVWTAEPKEDEDGNITVSYKGETGRYFWLKKKVENSSAVFASVELGNSEMVEAFNVASTEITTFRDFVPLYHQGHIRMLNDIRIHDLELMATVSDVQTFDFTRLYYFKQEKAYYKVNKITWSEGKVPVAECIRIKI